MKTKTIITVVLLGFVAVSLGWLIVHQGQPPKPATEAKPTPSGDSGPGASVRPDRVIVYYFHTTNRCPTCLKIESYTQAAVETGFAQTLRDGRLSFCALNLDEAANAHFVEDFQLHTKSVVVVDLRNGAQARWKNLPRVWELVGNQEEFAKYIREEVNLYLQGT